MTESDLVAIVGEEPAGLLIDALHGGEGACYAVRLDNKNTFSSVEVEVDCPRPLRARFEKGAVSWVRPIDGGKSIPFGRKSLGDPQLDGILKTVSNLHPIKDVVSEPGRLAFRFFKPVPWPLFAVLEFARAFQPAAAQWARAAVTHEVRSFGLGAGVMDVELT